MVADQLSRLPRQNIPEELDAYFDCFPTEEPDHTKHPISYRQLELAQHSDKKLMKLFQDDKPGYHMSEFHGGGKDWSLICYNEKIVVPKQLQRHVMDWYHSVLCHPGINRTEERIGQHLWWPKMRDQITSFVKACPVCQRSKRKHKKYGTLPPKEAEATPWDKLCVDLIGPYKIRRKGKEDLVCKCVTMIDPATGWFEIHQYDDKRSITVANIVEQEWFNRYPWPTQVTFDRGSEFIGQDFKGMIQDYHGVNAKPITVRKSTS